MKKLEFPFMFHIVKTIRARLRDWRIAKEGSTLDFVLTASFCKEVWSFLRKLSPEAMEKYKDVTENTASGFGDKIWTCWWQGEENAPPLIKICLDSIRKNAGTHEVVVLDKDNLSDYVAIPEYILEKHEAGIIRTVSFTDVMRMYLLEKNGGLWLDATVFCFKPIPEEIWSLPLFTLKYYSDHFKRLETGKDNKDPAFSDNRIGGKSGHPLFCFSCDILAEYWKKHNSLIVYGVLFCIIQLAYDTIPLVKKDIDALPIYAYNPYSLREIFNKAYDKNEVEALASSDAMFFKMDWKEKYKKYTDTGEETVYKRFLDGTLT